MFFFLSFLIKNIEKVSRSSRVNCKVKNSRESRNRFVNCDSRANKHIINPIVLSSERDHVCHGARLMKFIFHRNEEGGQFDNIISGRESQAERGRMKTHKPW